MIPPFQERSSCVVLKLADLVDRPSAPPFDDGGVSVPVDKVPPPLKPTSCLNSTSSSR